MKKNNVPRKNSEFIHTNQKLYLKNIPHNYIGLFKKNQNENIDKIKFEFLKKKKLSFFNKIKNLETYYFKEIFRKY